MSKAIHSEAKISTTIRVVPRDDRDILGEGPIWSPRRNAIFWVDILGQRVNSLSLESERVTTWQMPEHIGWIIERDKRDDFIVGLKSGFATLSLDPFAIEHVGDPEPDRPRNRLNDAKTDPAGNIWAGSMDHGETDPTGALYRIDAGLSWSRQDDGYVVANGPTFSLDGRTIYHTDSIKRTVFAFDVPIDSPVDSKASRELAAKRIFLQFQPEWGYPDGMATDAEGGVWIAHWGGSRLSRFLPDGRLDRSIGLPASKITSCVFAGPNLERMFVTSASIESEEEPQAGALFEVDPGVRGAAVPPFAG
jgi:sugar lactone lactonase YvrE